MAGALTVTTKVDITGLGTEINVSEIITMTVPIEYQEGYTVVDGQTTAVDLFDMADHIILTKIYGVFLKAEVDKIYILLDTAGTATYVETDADLVLQEGEACWLPINPANNAGLSIDGDQATSALSWMIVGEA